MATKTPIPIFNKGDLLGVCSWFSCGHSLKKTFSLFIPSKVPQTFNISSG